MRTLLTGARGMLGSSLQRYWAESAGELVAVGRAEADLTTPAATAALFERTRPEVVVHAAARVGGIAANMSSQSSFLMDNLMIDANVIRSAREVGVSKLLYIGSSCMYPKDYRQPLIESDILAAPLEPTNEGYAIAKIAGGKYCEFLSMENDVDFKVIIPSNLYGPDDDYSLARGHLVAAAIRKAHLAKSMSAATIDVWGDGTARREFTFVDDLAKWIVATVPYIRQLPSYLNVGVGVDHSVLDYYRYALATVGYECELVTDPSKPAGMHQKLMDSSAAREFNWDPSTDIATGMALAYERFLASDSSRT